MDNVANRHAKVDEFISQGFEGAVLKDPGARYHDSRAWLKYKVKTTVDAQVTNFEYGAVGSKYALTVGALKVSVIDRATGKLREIARVAPGDDHERDEWFNLLTSYGPEEEIIAHNEIIELEGQQWTKDGRIRHPRILRVRGDRSEPNTVDFSSSKPEVV